ncbi:WG repeat-containing protein [Sphingobacterium sp. SRCM116780]|uniref:WG repeat-containing protein n=1 Tax=Sphingobacterium sp. SRCM116780 TaxID=2907623 RepID=UPI001F1E8C13|nr:WG repeat-containing protein [Sphingobacterium sp. SRCM116780]UIR57704.1 WG repeat-containing protein [Sphingobacterium sp. SRCM116780]
MKILLTLSVILFHLSIYAQNDPKLFPVNDRKVGYLGYYLKDGTNIVKPQFCSASYHMDGYYRVSKAEHEFDIHGNRTENHVPNTEKFGLLNSKGQFIIDFKNDYDYIAVDKGIIYVLKNNFYGVVNDKNQIVIPIEYSNITIEDKNRIIAEKNGKYGILNYINEIIIPFDYDYISETSPNENDNGFYAIAEINQHYTVINQDNKYLFPLTETALIALTKKSILAEKDNKFGLVDYHLKPILPFDFETLTIYDEKLRATKNGYEYYYTIGGELIEKKRIPEEGVKN